ncbi:DUF885 domain-containing protein [Colwellia sp. MSW7]|uniref:DUF885 domain-containing protein n=1 Tax=Colwellia maritima TaxID=2912588 RepID=A0ABS9X1R5_9GAMM|nr:DUF885 domain-containing protein [Colwellia maritima]MCI2284125.1 DUF885 domain-containing protein [Colwellia maritima]
MLKKSLLVIAISSALLSACTEKQTTPTSNIGNAISQEKSTNVVMSESEKANKLFDAIFDAGVDRNPVRQTYLGIKKDYDKWNDLSEENAAKELSFAKSDLAKIKALDSSKLDAQTLISYQLYIQKLENKISDHKWRFHNYPVNQMFGTHSQVPAFLINQHSISNLKEAQDYISRVNGAKKLMEQLVTQLKLREDLGIIAPKFVFEHVIRDSKNILVGAPFDEGKDSTILADFTKKINKIDLSENDKLTLSNEIKTALTNELKPGYEQLISYLTELETKADNRDGAWKFPEGEAFFNNALKRTTTTDLTADEIHNIGLSEVERIHNEMRLIMKKVGFEGDLAEFFVFMRTDKQFYYSADEAGRKQYLDEAVALIDDMKGRLDSLFLMKPKAEVYVKAVEAFREKSAGKAFYQRPTPDGSRPGVYYANLYDMEAMPSYQMAALAYHEGIPGHHMQFAINQELTGIPKFRKFGGYTAHTEGWGLYSEMIPKEIGLYQDPYSDFGRLAMELWRACRLVVDTGIHTKKWTREQGIAYYATNTSNAKSDTVKMVERHIVMPSQATAYKIGMLKIIELRENAKVALGDKFDIREFHDVVLRNGPVPLNILTQLVDEYIKAKQA